MSLYQNLRTLGNMETVRVILTLDNGRVLDTFYPGSRVKNLNNFVMELDQVAHEYSGDIVKLQVEDFIISFE